MFGLLSVLIIFNLLFRGVGLLAAKNIIGVIIPLLIVPFFVVLSIEYGQSSSLKLMRFMLKIMNIYFFINIPIIILEKVTGSLFMSRFLSVNPTTVDQITGLIGLNGTAKMSLYWCTLIMGNYGLYLIYKKRIFGLLIFTELIVMFIFSQFFSEIKNFIPTLLVFFIVFSMNRFSSNLNLKTLIKIIILFIGIAVVLVVTYNTVNAFALLMNKFILIGQQFISGSGDGSDIRIHTSWVALNQLRNIGFNNMDFSSQTFVAQLDVISFNSLVVYGGVSFFICIVVFTAVLLASTIRKKYDVKYMICILSMILLMVYISFITVPFQDTSILFFIFLFAYFISVINTTLIGD